MQISPILEYDNYIKLKFLVFSKKYEEYFLQGVLGRLATHEVVNC